MNVRSYEARDRAAVREICCDTADRGEPVENFFSDRELIADVVTRYYTDVDSRATWVAEQDGQVVGYLTGCLDNDRHRRVTMGRILPVAVVRAIARGTLWEGQTARILAAGFRVWRSGQLCRPKQPDDFGGHVHVNVRRQYRGRDVGRQLMERFFEQARRAGVAGIVANVREDNTGGRKFFERMGFTPLGRYPILSMTGVSHAVGYAVVYGKKL
jgi:ribosomal protein S18 acetylase RimI-like enzyme